MTLQSEFSIPLFSDTHRAEKLHRASSSPQSTSILKNSLISLEYFHRNNSVFLRRQIEPSWKIFDEFFTTVLQNEMDAEILNPSEKSLNVVWVPHLKRLNTRQLVYPLNETTVFQNTESAPDILYSTKNEREVDPTIYSELFVQRNINKGLVQI